MKEIIKLAIKEDIGKGDVTTDYIISPEQRGKALIIAKEAGILAGGEVAKKVFHTIDKEIKFIQKIPDGNKFKKNEKLFEIEGKISSILKAERTALNFLQHLSGIATLTNKYVEKTKGTKTKILDTRKTTPGLRELEKYAVRCGGGINHRMGLYDMILIKDNHITAAGGIKNAINKIRNNNVKQGFSPVIEIEVKNLDELKEALSCDVDIIMLDNMEIKEIKEAVKIAKNHNVKLEVSGGINLRNIEKIAKTGVDYISIGRITHSIRSIDMSLKLMID